jgi:hypothetical protein
MNLEGKVAIVTGAASYHGEDMWPRPGSGSAVAAKLASLGAAVVLADLNGEAAERRAHEIRQAGGEAVAVEIDVREESQVERMVATAVDEFGRLDILHNNAYNGLMAFDPGDPEITQMSVDTWQDGFRTLVLGPMLGCKHAIPRMIETGGGSIVCTTSVSGEMGELNLTIYAAAKAAVNQVVRSVSTQYGKQGIRCNAIAPGLVLSPPALQTGESVIDMYTRHSDTPYVGRPEDIAEAVAFLASDASRYISGQVIRVDGGFQQHSPLIAESRTSGLVAGETTS